MVRASRKRLGREGEEKRPTKLHVNFLSCLRSIVSAASGFIAAYELTSSSMIDGDGSGDRSGGRGGTDEGGKL